MHNNNRLLHRYWKIKGKYYLKSHSLTECYGSFVEVGCKQHPNGIYTTYLSDIEYDTSELIVEQGTGWKDKHMTSLWEGDVVETLQHKRGFVKFDEEKGQLLVESQGEDYSFLDFLQCADNFEIIGNINENSDLLNTKEEQ